jgi:putative transposase
MLEYPRYLGEEIMSRKRKSYSAEFKTKVVLELLSGEYTTAQVASKYEITANSLQSWKKQFLENASLAFDVGSATKAYKDEIEELKTENDALAKKLGKTTIERDWLQGKLNSSVSLKNKKELVQTGLKSISITRQCELLQMNRSTLYYEEKPISQYDLKLMQRIDQIYTDISSTYGYRYMHRQLLEDGFQVGVNKVNKLMNIMGIQAIFPKKKRHTSVKNHEHKVYPYLLRNIDIDKPNKVWSGDITYIPIKGGHVYLAAIIDWYSKSILAYKISSTMDAALATDVLREAIALYGTPEIFNSDQGSQYTSYEHTKALKDHNIQISMNGKGRSIDNIAIERFFRTLKYDEIYLNEYISILDLKSKVSKYINFYNHNRFHSALDYKKPMNVYLEGVKKVA